MRANNESQLKASLPRHLAEIRPSADLDDLPAAQLEALAFGGRYWHWVKDADPQLHAAWRACPEDVAAAFIAEVMGLRRREAAGPGPEGVTDNGGS
jgi:hypothetical protein